MNQQEKVQQTEVSAKELMRQMGYRHGRESLNMSSSSPEYREGYIQGRRELVEHNLRHPPDERTEYEWEYDL